MQLAAEIEASLRRFENAASVDVRENGIRVATIGAFSWELKGALTKPVLRFSLDEYSATHSVLAIRSCSEDSLSLSIQQIGSQPGRLDFVRRDYESSPVEVERREFCARFTRILAEQFPDETLETPLTNAEDLEHSLSANYARGVIRKGSERWAVLAVPESKSSAASSNCLTSGLLWLARARETAQKGSIAGLKLIVRKGASEIPIRLAKALSSSIQLEVYEFDLRSESIVRVDPTSFVNRDNWLVTCRNRESLLDQAARELSAIVAVSPQAITLHPNVQGGEVVLRFHGLAFARWHDGAVFFGATGNLRKKLTPASEFELSRLLRDLENYRHPSATNTRHALYRAQPERWLESIIRSDVTRVDACLDPRFVYTQLFASSATERSILDILTVTTSGRLAIIELKASEHIHLPLQAADYWLRIRQHLERGDFAHCGYFPKLELQKTPPLVYLVAPALRFHSTTGALLRNLSSSMEVIRVGLAENWRRGARVVMRQS
jgi:hypothetical protein